MTNRPRASRIAAARLRVKAERQLGRNVPEWVRHLADKQLKLQYGDGALMAADPACTT